MNSVLANYINKHIKDLADNGVIVLVHPEDRTVEVRTTISQMGEGRWFVRVLDATLWVCRRFFALGYDVVQPQPVGMWLDEMELFVQQNRNKWQRP